MLKYSTYQSIYDKPAPRRSWNNIITVSGWSRKLGKVCLLLFVLMITGTGVVTAFAAASDGHVRSELPTIVVKPGDTLWEIAVNHKPHGKDTRIYVESIIRLNGLNGSNIHSGDTIILPN